MSIIKKYSKTFIGLSALGLGAVSPVAHADTTESYPAEIEQLISEAKSLGITVVEEPTTQVQNDKDLQTYYEELTKQLERLFNHINRPNQLMIKLQQNISKLKLTIKKP